MPLPQKAPYWRLSSLYFFYFTAVGVVLPYWGFYLHSLGFSSVQVGVLVSIPMATKIVAPYIWGVLADKKGWYIGVIRLGAFSAAVAFVGVVLRTDYWGLVIFSVLFSFFWNAILPQFEVITLDALAQKTQHYSRVRLWGSIGFIFAVVVLGWLFERVSIERLPWFLWAILVTIFLSSCALPGSITRSRNPGQAGRTSFISNLKRVHVRNFFIASVLLHISHGVFYGFFTVRLDEVGYSTTQIGLLWALGVIAEIVMFVFIPAIFQRYSLWHCYTVGFAASTLRWCLVAWFAHSPAIMFFSQLLHAFSFGVTHAVAIDIVRRSFEDQDRGKAQAFYSATCFGFGGASGAIVSGFLWDFDGPLSFLFAALVSGLGTIIVVRGMGYFRATTSVPRSH